jgi:elongation factor Ts
MDIEKIKHLRDSTGLSFNEIKKALQEAGDDSAKALKLLQERGVAIASKKASRQVKEGVISCYTHATKKLGAMIELLCETDFVARNSEFQALAHELAMHIAAMKPADAKEFLQQPYIKDQDVTVQELINRSIAKLGENIQLGRFEVFEI